MAQDRRHRGITLAMITAAVSGVAVYVNGNGVRAVGDATVYTTVKNLVAALVLMGLAAGAARRSARSSGRVRTSWRGAVVAVLGGSVPFVLFFEGLAQADSVDAAFIHKTLVVWVALLAGPVLGERLAGRHVVAITLLMLGYVGLSGGVPSVGWGRGEAMIVAATLLWSAEVVVAKRLLAKVPSATLAAWRMGGGTVVLLAWLGATGRGAALTGLDATAWGWALLTGLLLSVYVATWYAALALAPALDVTAVLVAGAILTALLGAGLDGAPLGPDLPWLGLLAAGVVTVATGHGASRDLARVPVATRRRT